VRLTKEALLLLVLAGLGSGGCPDAPGGAPDAGSAPAADGGGASERTDIPYNYVAHLPKGERQRAALCALERDDRFRRFYCSGTTAPRLDGIATLLAGVGLGQRGFGINGDGDALSVTAHSTALGPLGASVLNPRVIFLSRSDQPELAAVIFTRGERMVELAMKDLVHQQINFYALVYRLPCGDDCREADRHLDAADAGWSDVTVYTEADLHNTPLDCLRCHVTFGGVNGARLLRMHELDNPWTHWFDQTTGSAVLGEQFAASRPPGATYAGLPVAELVEASAPFELQNFIMDQGTFFQPNRYRGEAVNQDDPSVSSPSAAWLEMYEAAQQGKTIDAPPHFAISPFVKDAVARASAAYREVAAGRQPPDALPSVTRGLWDEAGLRYIGYKPAAGLDARGIVLHVCSPCHDGRFPGVSRDNFRAADFPDRLDEEMRARVVHRLGLAKDDPLLMPPLIASELEPEEIEKVRAALGRP
jgi:hypothetical protein